MSGDDPTGGRERPGEGPPPSAPAPPQTYALRAAAATNGYAIASLVLGIVWMFGLGSVLALVFGYLARSQIDRSGGREAGRGLATAGIVLGWVGVAGVLLVFGLFACASASLAPADDPVIVGP